MKNAIKRTLKNRGLWPYLLRLRISLLGSNGYYNQLMPAVDFYSQFVTKHDLCFDIGANAGNVTQALRACGARVIAVEPQNDLAAYIQSTFADDASVKVECLAIADSDGYRDFYKATNDRVSSLSAEWIEAAKTDQRMPEVSWSEPVQISVASVQSLVASHGLPSFMKVDVEGYEAKVLCGLTQPIQLIEFEATRINSDIAISVVQHLNSLADYRYNVFPIRGEKKLAHVTWLNGSELLDELENWEGYLCKPECEKKANILAKVNGSG